MLKVGDIYRIKPDSYKFYAGDVQDVIKQRYMVIRFATDSDAVFFKSWKIGSDSDPGEYECPRENFILHIEKVNDKIITKRMVIV